MTILTTDLIDLDATQRHAEDIASHIQVPMTIALIGTLGVGKTQWIRFFASALGVCSEDVTSPTYVLHQRYRGRVLIHHFDLYRLNSAAEVWDLGIDELYEQPAVVLLEWADKFPECLPEDCLTLRLDQTGTSRRARLSASGPASAALLAALGEN